MFINFFEKKLKKIIVKHTLILKLLVMDKIQSSNQNIVLGPDYGQLIKSQTNSAIIEAFLSFLFSKNTNLNIKNLTIMIRNLFIIIVVKFLLDDSKSYLDTIKITNLNIFRYFYQYIRYSEVKYEFTQIGCKWVYNNKHISINTLTPYLEQKSIYRSQPGTYYWNYRGYLIKVIISENKIIFNVPDIDFIHKFIESEIIHKHEEILFGGKTSMSKIIVSSSGLIKMEPVHFVHAFPTDNYIHLEECIKSIMCLDSFIKTTNVPFCVNFDGKPGTGKTSFANYIASSGLFNRIIIYNLVQSTNFNLQELVSHIKRQIELVSTRDKKQDDNSEYILIIFDEIDKWLESYIENQINKLREEARSIKQSSDGKNNITTESYGKLSISEENDKKIYLKNEFLDHLYKLVEGNGLSDIHKYVIIFNTNHFERLFDDVDKRFDALRDRFNKYKFEEIGKSQIIYYLQSFINKITSYSMQIDNPKYQIYSSIVKKMSNIDPSIYQTIPDNIKISYRTLHKILQNSKADIVQTVKTLSDENNVQFFSMNYFL